MRIIKFIFRVDYPLNYSLIDKLGEFLDFIKNQTTKKPFKDVKNSISIAEHIITSEGTIQENKFQINLNVSSFNGEVEFIKSIDFNDIMKCQLFSLVESVIEKMQFGKNCDFNRIGLRIYVVDENEKFKFESVLENILTKNKSFVGSISKHLDKVNDVGLIFESINDSSDSFRLNLGPYKEKERKKYFTIDPEIVEGLIIDLDVWQSKITIPEFRLTNMIKQKIKLYNEVLPAIASDLLEELK